MAKKVALSPRGAVAAGAIYTYLRPKLAMDAKIDLQACLAPMKGGKQFSQVKPQIAAAIRSVSNGKLAQDADIEDVANMLDAISAVVDEPESSIPEGLGEENGEVELEVEPDDDDMTRDDDMPELMAKIREFLKAKVDEETLAQFDQLVGGGTTGPIEGAEPEDLELEDDEEDQMNRDSRRGAMDTYPKMKPAMDEAIKRERENQRAIFRAINHIKPITGELAAMRDMAFDSADEVFAAGLTHLGIKTEGIHSSAYQALFDAHAAGRTRTAAQRSPRVAQDGALPTGVKPLSERLPGTRRIQVL